MDALLELGHVLPNVRAANTGMTLNVHIVTQGDNDLLDLLGKLTGWREDEGLGSLDAHVELLENGYGKSSSLARSGLGLCNNVVAFDNGHDGALLDSRGPFKTNSAVSRREKGEKGGLLTRKRRHLSTARA